MKNLLTGTALLLALVLSPAIYAQDHHDDQGSQRYYDSKHKDYHSWNSDENQRYHQYLQENHKKDHDFNKSSKRDQQSYWDYRHQHESSH